MVTGLSDKEITVIEKKGINNTLNTSVYIWEILYFLENLKFFKKADF